MFYQDLLKSKSAEDTVRIWIAGCATGQEAYSMGICLQEVLETRSEVMKVQIFASDISEHAIRKARAGRYSQADMQNVSETRIKKHFTKTNGGYEVNKNIRDMCIFAPHNFFKDPPFAKMDMISCRNVLIYMDTFLQRKALANFHYSLNDKGLLLLGKSETTSSSPDLFAPFIKSEKIYIRKNVPGRFTHLLGENKEQEASSKKNIHTPGK
jgi:two-component system CheB/CheR fusion protein